MAAAAFVHTATYDVTVASWMGNVLTDTSAGTGFPNWIGGTWDKAAVLRYGENPHQPAALYRNGHLPGGLATAEQLHGKEMSYNNYVDADAARRAAYDFDGPAVAIIKHANPCGIAVGTDIADAHRKAHACDPVSAFGGVIATNRPVSVEMARQVAEVFTEVILAPAYDEGAVAMLSAKKNLRILVVEPYRRGGAESRRIDGGMLLQAVDRVDAEHDRACGLAAGGRGAGCARTYWPTWSSPGGPYAGSSRTRSCWPATARRSASAWVRSTGWTPAGWRCSGPATGPPGRWPPRTPSSPSPTARRSCWRPG